MSDDATVRRWDQTRNRKRRVIDLAGERGNWRCLNPQCRGQLPAWRIGYCGDQCSSQHRTQLFADYMRAKYGPDWARTDTAPARPAG